MLSRAATVFITLPPRLPIPMTATQMRSLAPAQLRDVPRSEAAPNGGGLQKIAAMEWFS